MVKMSGHLLRPDASFPEEGYGVGKSQEDMVIRGNKLCTQYFICLAVLDEAGAADGTCPLELLADCSGIAWGGSAYQMVADLSHFKVLMTAGKGLTPAQQALVQESHASKFKTVPRWTKLRRSRASREQGFN